MLIVMEYRDIQLFLEPAFDLETARRRNILEVYAAETDGQVFHSGDNFIRLFVRRQMG
jgi:hypothetical protein